MALAYAALLFPSDLSFTTRKYTQKSTNLARSFGTTYPKLLVIQYGTARRFRDLTYSDIGI
jgi:hypothetical protein